MPRSAVRTAMRRNATLIAVRLDSASWQRQSLPTRAMTWICYELVRFMTGWSSYGRAREFK